MAGPKKNLPYKDDDPSSIISYAGKLTGRTLREVTELLLDSDAPAVHTKGRFGQMLEEGYFFIENNNLAEPDFIKVGIELKSTPMRKGAKGEFLSKERLVLSIINYMTINSLKFEGSFKKKNGKLLIVFYEWKKGQRYDEYRILKVVHWTFPPEDLRIIQEDWNIIAKMVAEGKAEKLHEGLTNYLSACRKGVGHDSDDREQPESDNPAKQRALSLKSSYVSKMFRESTIEEYKGVFTHEKEISDPSSVFSVKEWLGQGSFDDYIRDHFDRYKGRALTDIESMLGESVGRGKAYRAILVMRMLGVRTKHVKEFVDAGISVKTIFLKTNGTPQESMAFPYFKYQEVTEQTWETSDFSEQLDRRFLFAVFRDSGVGDDVFVGVFFWSMPYDDLMEAKRVWNETARKVRAFDMDDLPGSEQSAVAHVRPHGRDSKDLCMAADGKEYQKRSFWLNRRYIDKIVKESGVLD